MLEHRGNLLKVGPREHPKPFAQADKDFFSWKNTWT